MSGGPKVSRTRICADDAGSCLKVFKNLKTQYTIWRLAAQVSGLVLKPSKCFSVFTCVPLTPKIKQAISLWFRNEVPEWKNTQVVVRGMYLGVYLRVGGCEKTFDGCEEKCMCSHFSLSVATGLLTIDGYNERAVPVFK